MNALVWMLIVYCLCFFWSTSFQIAAEYSECPSGKKGGDLGWFPRGKMAGPFQEVAFNTPVGVTSAPFKSTYAFNFLLLKLLHQQVFGSFGSLAVSFPHIIAYVSCFMMQAWIPHNLV